MSKASSAKTPPKATNAQSASSRSRDAATAHTAKDTAGDQAASKLAKFIPWLLVVGGFFGLFCSFVIAFDEFKLYQNPHFVPSCNLNPIISCGSVMQSKQAHLFGFPNPFIGLMAFPVLITMGMAALAGAKFKRWFWLGLETATVLALVFVHWLFFETVYRIHALCPYCMGAWAVTITTFWYVTLYNIETGVIPMNGSRAKFAALLRRHHLDILVLWFLIIAGLILKHFWYYYGKHL